MRITMVLGTDYLLPVLDGRVAREAAALHSAGHQVTVICWARSASGELVDGPVEEVVNNVQIHRIFSPVSTADAPLPKRIIQHIQAKRRLAHVLHKIDTDAIHFHDLDTAVITLLQPPKQPWVYDSHEDYAGMVSHLPWPLPRLASFLERLVVRRANGVITVSSHILRRLARYGARRRLLVLNAHDPAHFITDGNPAILREAWGVGPEDLIILYVGSLGPGRSILEAIEAVEQRPGTRLILGGHGMWTRKVEQSVMKARHTVFLGPVPSEELPNMFAASDIILGVRDPAIPDHAVAMPNKLFEAAVAGRPLLAAKGTLVGKIVSQKELGELVEYGNVESMVAALDVLADPVVRQTYGSNGLRLSVGRLGWRWQAQKLQYLYQNLDKK